MFKDLNKFDELTEAEFQNFIKTCVYVNTQDSDYCVRFITQDVYVSYVFEHNENKKHILLLRHIHNTLSEAIDCVIYQFLIDARDFYDFIK